MSKAQGQPTTPPRTKWPFLSDLIVVPPPRPAQKALSVASTIGWPDSSSTKPSMRPVPRQSCARAAVASEREAVTAQHATAARALKDRMTTS